MSHSPEMFTLSCRESGDEERTDLEMRSATKKYTIGSVDAEYAERIVACVNACRCIPTNVLGEVIDRLFTAMMTAEGVRRKSLSLDGFVRLVTGDLLSAAITLENSGVDLTELLKQCELRKVQQRPTEPAEKV